ncbi:unnamed protein product [Ceratitis capitata]|uniref:(Mediterranean fruit fly) hypothetical protein n=1 Tax=Ceratitis capitata TaxID=7213 RepID=A0A811VE56_CERCA|nr:unnamed protein product [Ceratitis capitata]
MNSDNIGNRSTHQQRLIHSNSNQPASIQNNKTSGEPQIEPNQNPSNSNNSDCVSRIKKVQFSNENITIEENHHHNDIDASIQLNDHHQHQNHQYNSNNVDLSSNNSDSSNNSEIGMSNDAAAERPSFLVGDEVEANGHDEVSEASDEFPQKMQNEMRPQHDLMERRKRLSCTVHKDS